MPSSEDELAEINRQNDELRDKIAAAESAKAQIQSQIETDTRIAAAKAEQARLNAQLEATIAEAEAVIDIAVEVSEAAAAEPKTAYQRMLDEAEEVRIQAQADADEKVRRAGLSEEERKKEDEQIAKQAELDAQPVPEPV